MKILISPSKTIKVFEQSILYDMQNREDFNTGFIFEKKVNYIIDYLMNKLDFETLNKSYKVSNDIFINTYNNFKNFNNLPLLDPLYAFDGLQFKNIDVEDLNNQSIDYLRKHLVIMSALYGVIPADTPFKQYRLDYDQKLKFENTKHEDIFTDGICNYLNDEDFIVNLASKEYQTTFIKSNKLADKIYTIKFVVTKDMKRFKEMSTYSKIYRGKFVNYLSKNEVESVKDLKLFTAPNVSFSEKLSSEHELIYVVRN